MFELPERPQDLSGLTRTELSALAASIRTAVLGARSLPRTPELVARLREAREFADAVNARIAELDSADGDASGLFDSFDEPAADPAPAAPADEATTDPAPAAAADAASTPPAPAPAAPSAGALAASAGATPAASSTPAPARNPSRVVAAVTGGGYDAGAPLESMADIAKAFSARIKATSNANTAEKFVVARVLGTVPDDRQLNGNFDHDMAIFGGADFLDADVQAAICAPREPIYDLSFGSSVVRPVAASLASYGAPRGGVSIYPTPRLSDISDGTGIWTRDDDADDAATKADCAVITCGSPEDYDIYGIYRCMTVTNMAAMTYPELVAAFLNRLQATQAQLGERTLLNAMRTDVNTIKVHSDGINVGMSIALLETLLRTIQSYKEQERYGDDIGFDCWLPRHVRTMLVVDQLRRKRTDNVSLGDIVSASKEITAAFTSAGVNPTWTYESASGWPTLSSLVNGSAIPQWPTTVKMLMTPTGNFRRLDGGELNLGVGGNTVRDTTSLSKNNFTMFWESFEGLVAFGARSLELTLVDVCPGGHQVADVTLDCETTQS